MKTLKQLREAEKLSQSQLARDTGLHAPVICNIENGTSLPTMEDIVTFVRRYQQPIEFTDNIDDFDKKLIMDAINTLGRQYPLMSVLHFALKAIKADLKQGNASSSLTAVAEELENYKVEPSNI